MAEELQSLLERIQKESVEKAEKQADEIVVKAKDKAAALVKNAEEKAKQSLEKADVDAIAFTERSKKTLEQSARDLLITVGCGVENLFEKLVNGAVANALSADVVTKMLDKICDTSSIKQGVSISVNDADQKAIVEFFNAKLAEAVKNGGVEIKTDNEIIKGFTVSLKGQDVYIDFTREAIAEALMKFLRPQLADIVSKAANQK
jgi:V/A-type H+-transporting ATPase subunit E